MIGDTYTQYRDPRVSDEKKPKDEGRWWPIALIALSLVLVMLYLPMLFLLTPIFFYDPALYYFIGISFSSLAPLLYVLGVAFMHLDRMSGKRERARLSTIAGITLLLGVVFGIVILLAGINNVVLTGGLMLGNLPFVLDSLVLSILGIAGSLLGAFYALKRQSYVRALIAGGFSVFLMAPLFPLALVPIALGMIDAQEPR